MVTVFSSMAVIAPRKRTGVVCAEAVKLRPRTTAASRPAMKRMVGMVLLPGGDGTLAREIRTDRLRLREAGQMSTRCNRTAPVGLVRQGDRQSGVGIRRHAFGVVDVRRTYSRERHPSRLGIRPHHPGHRPWLRNLLSPALGQPPGE